MSEEQQQSSREYLFQMVTFPNTGPPVPHNQATMARDCVVSSIYQVILCSIAYSQWLSQIHLAPEGSQNGIFMPPTPAAHPAYCEPQHLGYAPYYGPITPVSLFT